MNRVKGWNVLRALFDKLFVALFLSATYPVVFLLSKNWYALSQEKIYFLLVFSLGSTVMVYGLFEIFLKLADVFYARMGFTARKGGIQTFKAVVMALLCSVYFFLLMYRTIEDIFKAAIVIVLAFTVLSLLIAWIFLRKKHRYYSILLAILTVVSLSQWGYSYVLFNVMPVGKLPHLSEKALFQDLQFSHKPNIFLVFFDAYGNRAMMESIFGLDNSPMYDFLEGKGFKTYDSFSNYSHTWPTTLATFFANHHYLKLFTGHWDTKYGRSIMSGILYNPVLHTLKNNGYRIQFINSNTYFTNENGILDYNYPTLPAFSTLSIFQNPVLDSFLSESKVFESTVVSPEKQLEEFQNRLNHIYHGSPGPWFTFSYFTVPGHSPTSGNWRTNSNYESTFGEKVKKTNKYIQLVVQRILEFDKDAVIIIMGDHGTWRYRDVWKPHKDPNQSFAVNGVSAEKVTLDIFSIMVAIYSAGKCDAQLYDTVTPVNIMRVIFACLSGNHRLMSERPSDVSFFSTNLFMTAKDGQILPRWEKIRRPE